MKTHKREILIYYNPESSSDRKTVAHAQGLGTHVKIYAHRKSPSSRTSWQQILHALDKHPKELLNKAHPYYQANIRGREFTKEGWVNVLKNTPEIIKAPIAIRGKEVILCNTPTDIYRLFNQSANQ